LPLDSQLQKFVVFRIAAGGDPLGDVRQLGRCIKDAASNKRNASRVQERVETRRKLSWDNSAGALSLKF
jgi:hypothetical protein